MQVLRTEVILKSLIYKIVFFLCLTKGIYALETTADEISIDSENGIYTLTGNAQAEENGKIFQANKIIVYKKDSEKRPSKIEAYGNVSYKEGDTIITSDDCESDMEFVIFSKNVILKGPEFGIIHADKAKYNTKNKTMDITSKKKVKLNLDKKLEAEFNEKNKKK